MPTLHRNFFDDLASNFLCQLLHLRHSQGTQLCRTINVVEYPRQCFPPILSFGFSYPETRLHATTSASSTDLLGKGENQGAPWKPGRGFPCTPFPNSSVDFAPGVMN